MGPTLESKQQNVAQQALDPSPIMQIGMGYWASKALLSAVKFGVFTILAGGRQSGAAIKQRLGLQTTDRHVYDWLDTLTGLGFLEREGLMDSAVYGNSAVTEAFLDKNKPGYIGGILEMSNNRLYRFWGDLEEGLLTGKPQNETKHKLIGGGFEELYKDPVRLQEFMNAMSGIQMGNFITLCKKFDFSKYPSMADIGGADGWLSIQVCRNHAGIRCITYDLPPVEPLAKKKIQMFDLAERIEVRSGDLLKDELPKATIITMGNILHGLNEESKQQVINKVFNTLPDGGLLMAIENVIDNERRQNVFGLLMSLNMLIENGDAFDYTFDDFNRWTLKAGFKKTELIPLAGPTSAAIAYK